MPDFTYANEQLTALYELGRLYYQLGYYAPAEKIFHGLVAVDNKQTAAKVGLGLIKLERGAFEEAASHFRQALDEGHYKLQAKLGMLTAFVAQDEILRARSLLEEIDNEVANQESLDPDLRKLIRALFKRCG